MEQFRLGANVEETVTPEPLRVKVIAHRKFLPNLGVAYWGFLIWGFLNFEVANWAFLNLRFAYWSFPNVLVC